RGGATPDPTPAPARRRERPRAGAGGLRLPRSRLTGWPQRVDRTLRAPRLLRMADRPPVVDQHVREGEPLLAGDQPHQILLDLRGIRLRAEPDSVGQPFDVGVDRDALDDPERIAEDDVRRL